MCMIKHQWRIAFKCGDISHEHIPIFLVSMEIYCLKSKIKEIENRKMTEVLNKGKFCYLERSKYGTTLAILIKGGRRLKLLKCGVKKENILPTLEK